jgi:hypothetical protein
MAATGLVPVVTKSKRKNLPCVNPDYPNDSPYEGGIPGPACSGQGEVIVNPGVLEQVCDNVKFCLVKSNPATRCPDEVWVSNDTTLSCDVIVGHGDPNVAKKLDPEPLNTFYVDTTTGKKVAKFLSSAKSGCSIRCMKFRAADGTNENCITILGVPFCGWGW